MRAFFQLFFGLLLTFSALFIAAAIIYFKIEYDLNKAFRLGVLSGFLIAIIVSFITTVFLLIMRIGKNPQKNILLKKKKQIANIPKSQTINSHNGKSIEQKIILLMDREFAFEVLLHAVSHQHIGILTQSQNKKETMSIKTANEIIELSINKLTRHTSELTILSNQNTKDTKKIITYMKRKELSLLQY